MRREAAGAARDASLDRLPILAVCGWSGSGKTTLIEAVLPRLRERGLSVVVVKHEVHGLDVDRPGKDSDRLFRAGADVHLRGEVEELVRAHRVEPSSFGDALLRLARCYDLVLMEGHKSAALAKVWLESADGAPPPPGCTGIIARLGPGADRPGALIALLGQWLPGQWLKAPVYACLLGAEEATGESGKALARAASLLGRGAERVVCIGAGCTDAIAVESGRFPPAPDAAGAVAGLLAALRWAPHACWLAAAPPWEGVTEDVLRRILGARRPGVWAVLPPAAARGGREPQAAYLDFRALRLLESLAGAGEESLGALRGRGHVLSLSPDGA
jgi:molybdopterin-guanine dinucleotide biosynthesis protein MobB